jgi:hypothetical protein
MRKKLPRILLAGVTGGITMYVGMFLTFTLVGGVGPEESGLILGSAAQSDKLVAVYTELEPLPKIWSDPLPMLVGLLGFGVLHTLVYQSVAPAWPEGVVSRALRFAGILLGVGFAFFEFWTPFNLFGEPLWLIAVELSFWAVVAGLEAVVIVGIYEADVSVGIPFTSASGTD